MVAPRGCFISKEIVRAQSCFATNSLQEIDRGGMFSVCNVPDGRLAHANTPRKCSVRRSGRLQIGPECSHMRQEHIGSPYSSAIGQSYERFIQNWLMARAQQRTFLERALEALRDRFPRERPTQIRLAKIAGVSQPAVHEWGLPERAPAHPQVLKLAKELNVCVEWLYTERGPKHPPQPDPAEPFLEKWQQLDDETRGQIARFADFIKTDK
jgi:hypothetical protein